MTSVRRCKKKNLPNMTYVRGSSSMVRCIIQHARRGRVPVQTKKNGGHAMHNATGSNARLFSSVRSASHASSGEQVETSEPSFISRPVSVTDGKWDLADAQAVDTALQVREPARARSHGPPPARAHLCLFPLAGRRAHRSAGREGGHQFSGGPPGPAGRRLGGAGRGDGPAKVQGKAADRRNLSQGRADGGRDSQHSKGLEGGPGGTRCDGWEVGAAPQGRVALRDDQGGMHLQRLLPRPKRP